LRSDSVNGRLKKRETDFFVKDEKDIEMCSIAAAKNIFHPFMSSKMDFHPFGDETLTKLKN
jgi:hypothetical protein